MLRVDGISDFDAPHSRCHDDDMQLYAFDILALDGYFAVGNLPLDLHRNRSLAEAVESERDPNALLN